MTRGTRQSRGRWASCGCLGAELDARAERQGGTSYALRTAGSGRSRARSPCCRSALLALALARNRRNPRTLG
eukprot:scaffold35873_cov41-Phaeocystis_antarctica.AAC.1